MQEHLPSLYNEVCHYFGETVTVSKVAQPLPQIKQKRTTIKVIRRRNALTDF